MKQKHNRPGRYTCHNLDGQVACVHARHGKPCTVIRTANYRRTVAYQRVKSIINNPRHMDGMVGSAKVVRPDGRVLEVIK